MRVFWNPATEVVRVLTLDVSEVNELEREERVDWRLFTEFVTEVRAHERILSF